MNTRRSFFRRFAGFVAAVAIAPEIAFRTKLDVPVVAGWDMGAGDEHHMMIYACNSDGIYKQLEECGKYAVGDEPFEARELLQQLNAIKPKRWVGPMW